jgi:peptidoglycan hydrolase-like protein with peptidoglycan-binding domain
MTNPFDSKIEHVRVHEPSGFVSLPGLGCRITALPLIDVSADFLCAARLGHGAVLPDGMRLPTTQELDALHRLSLFVKPVTLPTAAMLADVGIPLDSETAINAFRTRNMRSFAWCRVHDVSVMIKAQGLGWDGRQPISNFGKHWVRGGGIYGWWTDAAGVRKIQGLSYWHKSEGGYTDYATNVHGVIDDDDAPAGDDRPMRQTVKIGSRGPDVKALQGLLKLAADGIFGPKTELAVREYQRANGVVADGIVGPKTWALLGEKGGAASSSGYPGDAPAARAVLRDANARWPSRNRRSDGIAGDASHQARKSGHNIGNAVDVTHDPDSGCDGETIASLAITDPRTSYVIWNRRIFNRSISSAWRPYSGANGHTRHVHVEIKPELREDASPWRWAP